MGEPFYTKMEDNRYQYIHDVSKGPSQAIDVHHIILKNNASRGLILRVSSAFLLLLPFTCFLLSPQVQGNSVAVVLSVLLLGGCLIRLCLGKQVKKAESVVILPGFGVQLEAHYRSGRPVRHFIPASKILKPVLNECVTPVTCFWVLALIVRGEGELMLVLKELRPPVTMLVPIWKALCAAAGAGDCLESSQPQ